MRIPRGFKDVIGFLLVALLVSGLIGLFAGRAQQTALDSLDRRLDKLEQDLRPFIASESNQNTVLLREILRGDRVILLALRAFGVERGPEVVRIIGKFIERIERNLQGGDAGGPKGGGDG